MLFAAQTQIVVFYAHAAIFYMLPSSESNLTKSQGRLHERYLRAPMIELFTPN